MRRPPRLPLALMLFGLVACGGGDDGGPGVDPDLSVEADGPYPVLTTSAIEYDVARQRDLQIQIWYPVTPGPVMETIGIEDLEEEPHRTRYADFLNQAQFGCPTQTTRTVRPFPSTPAPGPFPLVAFSHCHECTRLSGLTIAARLASHGFVVVAVDHAGNTLWDRLDGTPLPLDGTTLALRARDLEFVIDELRTGPDFAFLAGSIDPERTGVFGHSFGSVTAGLVAQRGAIDAAFGLAAPMENPLLPGVTIEAIQVPLGFLVAREDNSISELGNELIRGNFLKATHGAWKIEVADAGHWSVSDVVGLQPAFAAGCGDGVRQTDGQPFTYLDPATGRDLAAAYVTAFFKATLEGDAGAEAYLETARPTPTVTVEHR